MTGHSRRRWIARNKNTRLEIVPPALSTPTFHQPRVLLLLMNRIEPSMSSTFTPLGWNELAAMNESMTS